jgi:putative thioredoxin
MRAEDFPMEYILGGKKPAPAQGAGATGPGGAAAGPNSQIKDTTTRTFAADVLDASMEVPVIVDFWAPWCGPCKQLTPILEKVVRESNGAVKLVKINIDENQEIARQFRIQSIPAVFAFHSGQPVDGFMGALPESEVRKFVKRLAQAGAAGKPSPTEELMEIAKQAFEQADLATAAQAYGQALQVEPGKPQALAGLARCYLQSGDKARAKQTIELVAPEARGDPEVANIIAQLALAEKSGDPKAIDRLRKAVEANPKDHHSRYDLAMAQIGAGDREGAVQSLLDIIGRDRNWEEGKARKELLTLFEAFGAADPVTVNGRRKLSSLLFS